MSRIARSRVRTAAATASVALLVPLAAACSSHDQGTAVRATADAVAAGKDGDTKPDCSPGSDLSQAEWIDKCSSAAPDKGGASADASPSQPNTELSVGDTFAYNDGVRVTVKSIQTITKFAEFDDHPSASETAFRVTYDMSNGTKKPLSLDDWSVNAEGATTGGEVDVAFVEQGSKEMTGRIAPGLTGTFTAEYSMAKSDGKSIVFTVTRMDDDMDVLAEDPNWTGDIK